MSKFLVGIGEEGGVGFLYIDWGTTDAMKVSRQGLEFCGKFIKFVISFFSYPNLLVQLTRLWPSLMYLHLFVVLVGILQIGNHGDSGFTFFQILSVGNLMFSEVLDAIYLCIQIETSASFYVESSVWFPNGFSVLFTSIFGNH